MRGVREPRDLRWAHDDPAQTLEPMTAPHATLKAKCGSPPGAV